jgi:hypothetical protein
MASLTYLIYFCIYQVGVFVCVAIAAVVLVALSQLLAGSPLEKYVSAAMAGLILCLVSAGSFLSHEAARRTTREGEHPIAAMRGALGDVRLVLSFLPWIGGLFRPPAPKRSPFDGPDDARFS